MKTYSFEYRFNPFVCMETIRVNLVTAHLVAEALFGKPRVMTDIEISFDPKARVIQLTGFGSVGQIVNTVFLGLVQNLCGEQCYQRIRLNSSHPQGRCHCQCQPKAKAENDQ